MGKPSKKSATKVEAAAPPAAVVAVSKSGKKGKREAENEIGKAVSAKKQKKDVAVVQAIEKTKTEAKTPKKKVEESSSSEEESDDSSSEDEKPAPKAAVPAKKPVLAGKKAESSSSEESSSDESEDEKPAAKAAPVKNGTVTKKVESSDSSEESEEESDEDEAPKPKAATKASQAVTKTVKKESSSSDDSSDEESEDDDETPAKVTAPAAKKAAPTPAKKAEASSSSEESDSDEEDDSDGSSDDEDAKPKKAAPAAKAPAKAAKKESSSDESDEEDSSDEESSEEDEPAKTPKKKDTDVEMVDAETKSAKKAPATPATPDVSTSKTLFAGNLSFRIEQSDVEEFFKECGEVVDVRFATDPDGQFKGFGHVEFATAEAAKKALELNGGDLAGRPVRLDLARERGEKGAYTPQSGKENSYQRGGQGQSQSIFVRGFDTSEGEDKIREALQNHFGACGEMTRCSIPPDRETGGVKGMAYIDFADPSGISKALELDGSDIGGGCYLTVNEAKPREPRGDFGGGRGGGRFDSGGRRGGGRFDSGGRRGGRFDSGGRRGGRDSGGRRGGRGGFNKPNLAAAGTGKKTTFNNDD